MPPKTARNTASNLDQAERLLIQRALAQAGGNVSKAAELLGVNRARIYRFMGQQEEKGGSQPG